MKLTKITFSFLLILCSILAFGQSESEPNNSFAQANLIELKDLTSAIKGSINPNKDVDFYKVEIPRGGVLILNILDVPSNIDMLVTLYDANQQKVTSKKANNGNPVNLNIQLCDAGTYYFQLKEDNNNGSSPELYNFKIAFDTSDIYECNDFISSASKVDLCKVVKGNIRLPNDWDYFSFDAIKGEAITVEISDYQSVFIPELTLYNDIQVPFKWDVGSQASLSISFIPETSGRHYVRVRALGTNSFEELYSLIIKDSSCGATNTDEIFNKKDVTLSPNPATNEVTLEIGKEIDLSESSIIIYDISGNELQNITNLSNNMFVDLNSFPKGVLIFKIISEGSSISKRIIKL